MALADAIGIVGHVSGTRAPSRHGVIVWRNTYPSRSPM